MPLIAKLYYLTRRSENLNEVLAFYKNKTMKKLQVNFSTDSALMISGIGLINQQLQIIASSKDNQLFISNQNRVLYCLSMVSKIYENALHDFELKQENLEIRLENPNLLERIKNEIKYFIVDFSNVITKAKNDAIQRLLRPKCQKFNINYKSEIGSLKTEIEQCFDWLHSNEKKPGIVSRKIRNACDIFKTNISNIFDYSLSSIFQIDENGKLYQDMQDDLRKQLDNVKIKGGFDINPNDLESISRQIEQLKQTIYIDYNNQLDEHIPSKIKAVLSKDSNNERLGRFCEEVSRSVDDIVKESGWREGVREERRNNNSRIKSKIKQIIDNLETEVISAVDRLSSTGFNECLDQIITKLKSILAKYESELFSLYAESETSVIEENLDKIKLKISQTSNCIDEIEKVHKNIKVLKLDH